jgi:diguanylate cyclase (GGDEF)-like protein
MKRKHIDFRELLERLLPLDELPSADRFRVHRALKTGVSTQLEQAAMIALSRLEQQGAVERLPSDPDDSDAGPPQLRFRSRDALDVITLELPEPRERDGVQLLPRASLPAHASAGLEALRRLMRLDDAFVTAEGAGEARPGLMEHLSEVGREFLAARDVRFFPVSDETESAESVDAALGLEARGRLDLILYAPDTLLSNRLRGLASRGVRAVVLAGVSAFDGSPLGHLEILSVEADPFRPEDLAMAALLADSCGGALERAARIEKLVFVDPLTTIYNRSYFDLQLKNEMARARRDGASMALCIVDIDDFKSFNTGYGYDAGNQVLIQVAQSLTHGVRPFDTVARWGGEEFAVLLTAPVQSSDVVEVAERLRTLVGRLTVPLEGLDGRIHEAGVTVSLGVAMFPHHGSDPRELWRTANRALLEAKRPPKNQVVFYSTG